MNQTINIRISGIQREISDKPTVVEYRGTLHSDSGQHYLRYTDPDGIKTIIKIRQGHAIVTRSGALSSVMDFNESERRRPKRSPASFFMFYSSARIFAAYSSASPSA